MGKTRELKVNGDPGLTFAWGHQRKYEKLIAKGYRLATTEDITGGDLVCGELLLFVTGTQTVKPKVVTKSISSPKKLVHKDGLKLHWAEPTTVQAKILKGYHVVAHNEIVGMDDSIDVVTHNGHLLLAKEVK